MKLLFTRIAVIVLSMTVFAASAYFYLKNDETVRQSAVPESNIPYSSAPDNAALLFDLPHGKILFELKFNENVLSVTVDPDDADCTEDCFTVAGDEQLVIGMIDRVGGIELLADGELLRFTGIQVIELLERAERPQELRNRVLKEYLKKVGQVGLTRRDFVFIIENSKTGLTVPDCFYWHEYMPELCNNWEIKF